MSSFSSLVGFAISNTSFSGENRTRKFLFRLFLCRSLLYDAVETQDVTSLAFFGLCSSASAPTTQFSKEEDRFK
jgi:hypothetical protein